MFSTRRVIKDGSEYFGPYTSMKTVSTLLDLIKGLYHLRNCNYDLAEDKIVNGKYSVCLEYHLGNCKGACEGFETEDAYNESIKAIKEILKGNFKDSLSQFKVQMKQCSEHMHFEEAQKIKEKIEVLENYQSKSTIVNPKISNVDVFSIMSDESYAYVNFLQLSYGSIIRSHTLEIKKKLEETDQELLELAIIEIRQRFHSNSKEIYVPFQVQVGDNLKVTIPKLGFKNGKPSKKDYRHFNIKTVEGPNDFASMEEVVYRRYKRLLDENQPLPQLVIIDGGKGQLSSALKILDTLNLRGKIAIIGIAKRLEELFYPNDPIPLYLDKKSETLKIIQQLRNEAHRFGIEHHRNRRSKSALNTELETISGIGDKTVVDLLKHFKSAKRIANAKLDELEVVVGISRAKKVYNFYLLRS